MPRRLTVVCKNGHKQEIVIGVFDKIGKCKECRCKVEIVWDEKGPGFRVKGLTKRF